MASIVSLKPADTETLGILQPIEFSIVDDTAPLTSLSAIWVKYEDDLDEVLVYDSQGFLFPFDTNSTVERPNNDDSNLKFSVVPEDGWLAPIEKFRVEFDDAGTTEILTVAENVTDLDAPLVFTLDEGAFNLVWIEFAHDKRSLLVWESDGFVGTFEGFSTRTPLGGGQFQYSLQEQGGFRDRIVAVKTLTYMLDGFEGDSSVVHTDNLTMTLRFQIGGSSTVTHTDACNLVKSAVPPLWWLQWTPQNSVASDANWFLNASHRVDMEEASPATTLADSIGSLDFPLGGTNFDTGVANGVVTTPADVEMLASRAASWGDVFGAGPVVASSALLDPGGLDDSIAIRLMFRIWSPTTSGMILLQKRTGGGAGYTVTVNGSGFVTVTVFDGTTTVNHFTTLRVDDGAWHYADIVLDKTAAEVRTRTDLEASASSSLAALTWTNITNAVGLQLVVAANNGGQCRKLGGFVGAAAEALDAQTESDFWTHGRDPNEGLPGEWGRGFGEPAGPISHTGTIYGPVRTSSDRVGQRVPWSGVQWPAMRDEGGLTLDETAQTYVTGYGYGQALYDATNRLIGGELLENATHWPTTSNMTPSAAVADVEDNIWGIRGARRLTSTGDGFIRSATIATQANTHHTIVACARFKRVNAVSTTVRLRVVDSTFTEIAVTSLVITDDDWHRVVVVANSDQVASSNIHVEIEIAGTEAAWVCGVALDYESGTAFVAQPHSNALIVNPAWSAITSVLTDGVIHTLLAGEFPEDTGEITARIAFEQDPSNNISDFDQWRNWRFYDWRFTGVLDPEGSGLQYRRDLRIVSQQQWRIDQHHSIDDAVIYTDRGVDPTLSELDVPHQWRYTRQNAKSTAGGLMDGHSCNARVRINLGAGGYKQINNYHDDWASLGTHVEEVEFGEIAAGFRRNNMYLGRFEVWDQTVGRSRFAETVDLLGLVADDGTDLSASSDDPGAVSPDEEIHFTPPNTVQAGYTTGASHYWDMDEASGATVAVDSVAAANLSKTGGAGFGDFMIRSTGITNGGDWATVWGSNHYFDGGLQAAGNGTMDAGGSIAFRLLFRCNELGTATAGLLGKISGLFGYTLAVNSAGVITWTVSDNALNSASVSTAAHNYADGAWHFVECIWDITDDTIRMRTEKEIWLSASSAAVTPTAIPSPLNVGLRGPIGVLTWDRGCNVAHVAGFEGATAEGLDGGGAPAFPTIVENLEHFPTMNAGNLTGTHTDTVYVPEQFGPADPTPESSATNGTGRRFRPAGLAQAARGRYQNVNTLAADFHGIPLSNEGDSGSFNYPRGWGYWGCRPWTNIIPDSDDASAWTFTNITESAQSGSQLATTFSRCNPYGFMEFRRFSTTGAGPWLAESPVIAVSGTNIGFSAWFHQGDATTIFPLKVSLWDDDLNAEIASTTLTTGTASNWFPVSVRAARGSVTNITIRIEYAVANSAELYYSGMVVQDDDDLIAVDNNLIQRTDGSSATTTDSYLSWTGELLDLLDRSAGNVRARTVGLDGQTQGAQNFIVDGYANGVKASNSRRQIWHDAVADQFEGQVANGTGVAQTPIAQVGEPTFRYPDVLDFAWDAGLAFEGTHARLNHVHEDGQGQADGPVSSFTTTGNQMDTVDFMSGYQGFLGRVLIFSTWIGHA